MRRARARGFTLLEVMVSLAILAMVSTLVYGAFDGMTKTKNALQRLDDRHHQGRVALSRLARDLSAAYLTLHTGPPTSQFPRVSAFIGKNGGPTDRIDFVAFSHLRVDRDSHQSDQAEIGYFTSRDPSVPDKLDLARRESSLLDDKPDKGGVVNVICEDIVSFDVQYLDPLSGEWADHWDSTQAAENVGRLPSYAKVSLVLRGGAGGEPIRFATQIPLAMQTPLGFALPAGVAVPGASNLPGGSGVPGGALPGAPGLPGGGSMFPTPGGGTMGGGR